ncbi:uncharacterized protein LACBIDRAFT_298999 [Laccaria bicolor S238N-H82]|uniref:Predicted protein n=1 Tax=Laccaria bicolor (strain S238N-H82 / ATCC MYA-4686) TaxID=486041 RepID=B0DDT1_LACBS|nr:uncharacterized protein LACBIDRAFT_298999 [Laccaria bicolor S238N-H82]EDR07266.1 predicted protein [Laccaria bicolor S238N-H82]|eukprot:XP_001882197.1 predicted protein [Laccaria bicolor S238N-H82]
MCLTAALVISRTFIHPIRHLPYSSHANPPLFISPWYRCLPFFPFTFPSFTSTLKYTHT